MQQSEYHNEECVHTHTHNTENPPKRNRKKTQMPGYQPALLCVCVCVFIPLCTAAFYGKKVPQPSINRNVNGRQ